MKIAIPSNTREEDALIYSHFARAPLFAVYEDGKLVGFFENPAANAFRGAGIAVVNFLQQLGVNAVAAVRIGRNALEGLAYYGIKVFQAPEAPIKVVAEKAFKGELQAFTWHGWGGWRRGRRFF